MKECFLKKMKLKKLKEIFDIEFDKKIKKKECLQKIRTHISNNYFCFIDKINANNINTANYCSPLKMFDYLASGRIIISSKLDGICEVLKHKKQLFAENRFVA